MGNNTIGVITRHTSDFQDILMKAPVNLVVMKPNELTLHDLDAMDAIAVIGGTHEEPLIFLPRDRVVLEKQLKNGKRIFSEFCGSIGHLYFAPPVTTRFDRLIFCGEEGDIDGLLPGDLLEEQCNLRIKPHDIACSTNRPILQYANVKAHSHMENIENLPGSISDRALWFDDPENLLVCNFRMADWVKTRFAPREKWRSVVDYIVSWLCGVPVKLERPDEAYHLRANDSSTPLDQQVASSVAQSIAWFSDAQMLVNEGKDGVKEGLGTEIYPGGKQRELAWIRADCTAETSLAFYMNYLRTGNDRDKEISDALISVCFDFMQYKDNGPLKGMLRWTEEAWGVCYQDDAARVLIPQLLKCLYSGSKEYLDECVDALQFLVRTTGTDGTRVQRTDNINLTEEHLSLLASTPGNYLCAHYNAFYLGALLLAYKITGIESFKQVGINGLETLMSVYPDTRREYSETQEVCRLIMPLSWLYWISGDDRHKEWLYKVTADLQRFRHESGGYLEWDTGYSSDRNESNEGEESTLLTRNGDPVVDLLYSLNWLPMGFAQAYFVTKDPYFKELWEGIAAFFHATQIQSSNKQIHGAWARALDVELMEVYGLAADVGWGPWAIESGWTVAEISAGLSMGLLEKDLTKHYG
ncbi:hypothetical protein [Paenibacillus nasutitermitis]|uniref:Uncharacterized protein n=1 Tax=Paenibacillus nasutitermitis TaxID=1652958 RepID=A0A917DRN4_9BACL|nr:hypothetical protein [Paenibacillus nasutitermitis]GGD60175.1 hypothetical protein GCM10010911_17550 [Paenibacillus nasutitermitis]